MYHHEIRYFVSCGVDFRTNVIRDVQKSLSFWVTTLACLRVMPKHMNSCDYWLLSLASVPASSCSDKLEMRAGRRVEFKQYTKSLRSLVQLSNVKFHWNPISSYYVRTDKTELVSQFCNVSFPNQTRISRKVPQSHYRSSTRDC
jgi:hypothetical protein